jgi:hypothetical protein
MERYAKFLGRDQGPVRVGAKGGPFLVTLHLYFGWLRHFDFNRRRHDLEHRQL